MKEFVQRWEIAVAAEENGDFLPKFRWRREDNIDDLPTKRLTPNDPDYHRYKCRGCFILGLSVDLSSAIEDRAITDPKVIAQIREFQEHRFNYQDGHFTSQEEIKLMNRIMDKTIEHLEQKKAR